MKIISWEEIGDCWQKDDSIENQKRMFQVMEGVFERLSKWPYDKTWSMVFEEEFMKEYNLMYDKPEPLRRVSRKRVPAGIENIIKTERPELNKLLNLGTKVSHGKMIVVHSRVEKSSSRPNGIKRKKGLFYDEFIKHHKGKIVHQIDETHTTNVSATTESLEKKRCYIKKKLWIIKKLNWERKFLIWQ